MSFKKQIIVNFFSLVLLFVSIIIFLLNSQGKLGGLQDFGATRFKDASRIAAIELEVAEIYAVAADAQINHQLKETKKDLAEIKKKMPVNISIIEKIADTENEKKWAQDFAKKYTDYVSTFENEMLPELEKIEVGNAKTKELDGKIDELRDETLKSLKFIYDSVRSESEKADQDFDQTFRDGFNLSVGASIAVIIIAILLAIYVSNKISTSLITINDLLFKSFEDITQNANRVAASAENLSQSTNQQASAIQETSATMEEMNSMIKKTADSAVESKELSKNSAQNALYGKTTSEHLMKSVKDIEENNKLIMAEVQHGNQRIGEIVELINEIGKKTKVINDIVFQTKLLSFNASVEASRAGEQGKGFSVVAGEIGKLALESGKAAIEISTMLEDSTQKVKLVIDETQKSVSDILSKGNLAVKQGFSVADETSKILQQLDNDVRMVDKNIADISDASDEQARGADQVTMAIHQMDQATQINSKLSKELFNYSKELTEQTFRLEKAMLEMQKIILGSKG